MSTPLGTNTSSPAPSTAASSVVEQSQRDAYVEVVLALVLALALIILLFVQLVVRSKLRHARLTFMRRRVRFDALHYASRPGDPRKVIVERSARYYRENKIVAPPQYERVIPAVNRDPLHDPRKEAKDMLRQMQAQLPASRTRGPPSRMTMRACVSCIRDVLDLHKAEKFLRIHEAVLFGVHVGDGTDGDVTTDELQFMRAYFVAIMKEIM